MRLTRLIRPRWRRILNPPAMGNRGEERGSGLLRGPSRTATSLQRLLPAKAATIERNRREVDPGEAGFETAENTHFAHQAAA